MAKLKTFLKVFFSIVLFGLLIAAVVCYSLFPQETKLVLDLIVDYVNRPLPIVGISLATLFVFIYMIYSKTSFGKKSLLELESKIDKAKIEYEKTKNFVEKVNNNVIAHENEINIVVNGLTSKVDYLVESIVKVAKTSPNAKINALGEEIEKEYVNKKQETNDYVLGARAYSEEEIKKLEQKVAELEQLLDKVVNSYERKETTND